MFPSLPIESTVLPLAIIIIPVGNNLTLDNSRPADVLVGNWDRGKPATFDFTVSSPLSAVNVVCMHTIAYNKMNQYYLIFNEGVIDVCDNQGEEFQGKQMPAVCVCGGGGGGAEECYVWL